MPSSVIPSKIKKLTASVNATLADRGIRHAVFLEGLKSGEANRVVKFLDEQLQPDLVRQIDTALPGARKLKGLRRLVKANDGMIRAGYRSIGKQLKKRLTGISVSEARFQQAMLKSVVPLGIDFELPSLNVLQNLVTKKPIRGALLDDWLDNASRRDINRVNNAMRIGIAQGESSASIINRIRGTSGANFTDGVLKISKREAASLVRTSVNNVVTEAREETYRVNDDVIKEVQYVATLDSRTTEICASLDGRTYPIGEGPRPPQHFQCRSTTVPITKSWKELGIDLKEAPPGTRASMDGQVSDRITFGPWLKKQPKWVQSQVLGDSKAALFRKGRLDIRKFTDVRQQPLGLGQLEKLESRSQSLSAPSIKNTSEDFEFRVNNPDSQNNWHRIILKRFNSGGAFTPKWGTRPGRQEFWDFLRERSPASRVKPPTPAPLVKPPKPIATKETVLSVPEPPKPNVAKPGGTGLPTKTSEMNGQQLSSHLDQFVKEDVDLTKWAKLEKSRIEKEFIDKYGPVHGKQDVRMPSDQRQKMWQEVDKISRIRKDKGIALKSKIQEALKVDDPMAWDVQFDTSIKGFSSKAKKMTSFLEDVVSKKGSGTSGTRVFIEQGGSRGNYLSGTATVSTNSNLGTWVHEMGHHLEDTFSGMREITNAWRRKRVANYKRQTLSEVTGKNYRSSEFTRADKFINPYMGKSYSGGATEILSMGIEELQANPLRFLKKDRDMFEMIIDVLRGTSIDPSKLMSISEFSSVQKAGRLLSV